MQREECRPAEPAPPPFITGDLVHIRLMFMKACSIGVLMRRARLRLIKYHRDDLDWGVVLVSCHAIDKTTSAFLSDVYLMRAWFSGPASAEPTGNSEEAYSWNLHGSGGAGLPGHVRNLRVLL